MSMPFVPETPSVTAARLDDHAAMEKAAQFLAGRGDTTPFHRPEWLAAVAAACGQQGLYLIAERAGRVCGLVPITEMRSALFGKALASSGFAVDGGILADDHATRKALTEAVLAHAGAHDFPSVELRGGALPGGPEWQIDETTYCGFCWDLADSEDAQLKAVPRKQRAEIRKGLKAGLQVETGRAQRDRDWHYQVYATSVRNLGTPVFPKRLFAEVLDRFVEDADILTVLHDGAPVASVLSLYHDGVVMPYWGGGVHAARMLRANEIMYFTLMRHAAGRGCTRFDFGRSKTGTGPWSYKKNWGFDPQPLRYVSWSRDGQKRDVNPNSPKYRAMVSAWQKLPLPVANMIGPWLSKGLG
jgi:FemAB-related protein (PEP-CTERM system-associated)